MTSTPPYGPRVDLPYQHNKPRSTNNQSGETKYPPLQTHIQTRCYPHSHWSNKVLTLTAARFPQCLPLRPRATEDQPQNPSLFLAFSFKCIPRENTGDNKALYHSRPSRSYMTSLPQASPTRRKQHLPCRPEGNIPSQQHPTTDIGMEKGPIPRRPTHQSKTPKKTTNLHPPPYTNH